MGVRNGPVARARRRIDADLAAIVADCAAARRGAGLSQRFVASACGVNGSTLARIESGATRAPDLRLLASIAGCVGLDLRLRAYPAGDPIRDAGQQRLLGRLRSRLHPSIAMPTEVPLPIDGDLRAWDAVLRAPAWHRPLEAETVIDDLQALERRLALKVRDGRVDGVILLVADTRRNRRAIASAPGAFQGFDRRTRRVLRELAAGRDPGGSSLVLL
jgi:transcriptional regulator with XRE-family HTH domain